MSRAFVKESDDAPEAGIARIHELPLPAKNYVTPRGYQLLQRELHELSVHTRPEIAGALHAATAASQELEIQPLKRRQREVESRIQYLTQRIQHAEVVDRPPTDRVFFGATVTFRANSGEPRTVRITGVDEADAAIGFISFVSPLAKALLRAREGDSVPFASPAGNDDLEIISVRYERASAGTE